MLLGKVRSVLLLILSLVCACAALAGGTGSEAKRVVILNATDPYLPAFRALDKAQRAAIVAGSRMPVEFYSESLDMHRFSPDLLEQEQLALLRKKYRDLKVDVVATSAPIALDFAQRHRAEIWPGAVIVFNSVSPDVLAEQSLEPRTIGLPVRLDLGQTLDLALTLRPEARRIAVVAGSGDSCCGRLAQVREVLARYAGRLDVQYFVGLTLAETVAAVQALPEDAVVLYLTMFRDGAGVPHVPRNVLTRIAAVSRAPVFGVFETYLGHGIAAGSIASYEAQGRTAGGLVAQVLNGEDPSTIGVAAPVESRCMADWRQLRHWDIDERRLPAGCEVRFKQVPEWYRHRWQIVVALTVILGQTALIVGLIVSHRRLRQAQTALRDEYGRRSEVEAIAARLRRRLARFSKQRSLGAMATTIAHEINQPLIAIQNYTQAARRRLLSDNEDKPKLLELCTKVEGQAERAGAITQRVRSLVNSSDPQLSPTAVGPLIEGVIRMLELEAEKLGCRLTCELAANVPEVSADALQVQLVLVNLLNNSMKSVCSGEQYGKQVSVDVRRIDDREVQISVTDHGPGVRPDRVADIFEPLSSGLGGGMGMGLAICRDIIETHGGRIWYEPNSAGGAIFRFTLRVADS